MKVIVTGGAGFIGSNLVRLLLERGHEVLNIDALTYAGNIHSLDGSADSPAYRFLHADVRDASLMRRTLREYAPDWVMHLAAESHVDRSIDDPGNFMTTNVMGTFSMLQAALEYYRSLEGEKKERFRFHHISTDEVYGSLGKEGLFTESTPYRPHSPYSASKASSDHLVRAWHDTYGLPVLITNCSNNYGPYQFPEKLIPVVILKALGGEPIPVYGKGENVRDWLYVGDHCEALLTVVSCGKRGKRTTSAAITRKPIWSWWSCCVPIWMNCGPGRTAGATGSKSPLCRTGRAMTCAMRLTLPKYGGNWDGLRARTILPDSERPFSGIWTMRNGGGASCPGNTAWNVLEPMARNLI